MGFSVAHLLEPAAAPVGGGAGSSLVCRAARKLYGLRAPAAALAAWARPAARSRSLLAVPDWRPRAMRSGLDAKRGTGRDRDRAKTERTWDARRDRNPEPDATGGGTERRPGRDARQDGTWDRDGPAAPGVGRDGAGQETGTGRNDRDARQDGDGDGTRDGDGRRGTGDGGPGATAAPAGRSAPPPSRAALDGTLRTRAQNCGHSNFQCVIVLSAMLYQWA